VQGFYRAGGLRCGTRGDRWRTWARTEVSEFTGLVGDVCGAADFAGDAGGVLGVGGGECAVEQSVGACSRFGMTIPIAIFMGLYMFKSTPGTNQGGRAEYDIGVVLLLASVLGRTLVCRDAVGVVADIYAAPDYLLDGHLRICGVGCCRCGCLLEPRDYLSTYVKLGTIALLVGWRVYRASGHQVFRALTQYVHGGGPIIKGTLFSVFVRDDRVRRDFRISFAGEFGDDARRC